MSQPPDDRRRMPWEPSEPASSEQPTVGWTPPSPPEPPATPQTGAPDSSPIDTSFAGESGQPVGWPEGPGDAPADVPVAADATAAATAPSPDEPAEPVSEPQSDVPPVAAAVPPPAPEPRNPLLSATAAPTVGWAAAAAPAATEIAPGLRFSGTGARFVALLIDLLITGIITSVASSALGFSASSRGTIAPAVGQGVLSAVVTGIYFVGFWSGGRRATVGQRLLNIQVGHAFDGAPLTLEQAIRRWLGLGFFLSVFSFTTSLAAISSVVEFAWYFVLLFTTISSGTKQGLHDRFAESAVVRPTNAGNGVVIGCLAVVVILAVISVLAIIALIALGSQVSDILEEVGRSV